MDNATLKYLLAAAFAIGVLYMMRTSEKFQPYDESDTSEFIRNAPSGVQYPKIARKTDGSLLKAVGKAQRPMNTGVSAQLLPKPTADDGFGQFAPNPEALIGKNFVDASRWVSLGAMTTRRNINRDLRAEPAIPKTNGISPWNQSSIEQQAQRNPLDCL